MSLSNLDARLQDEVRGELRALQQRLGVSCLFVTHDEQEALAVKLARWHILCDAP